MPELSYALPRFTGYSLSVMPGRPRPGRHPTIEEIKKAVSGHFRLPEVAMVTSRRSRDVARPRQVGMYLAKHLTPRSLPEIGRRFGGRDHTTVIHGVRQVEKLRASDAEFEGDVQATARILGCADRLPPASPPQPLPLFDWGVARG